MRRDSAKGRIRLPSDDHIRPNTSNYKYITFHGQRDFADVFIVKYLLFTTCYQTIQIIKVTFLTLIFKMDEPAPL